MKASDHNILLHRSRDYPIIWGERHPGQWRRESATQTLTHSKTLPTGKRRQAGPNGVCQVFVDLQAEGIWNCGVIR